MWRDFYRPELNCVISVMIVDECSNWLAYLFKDDIRPVAFLTLQPSSRSTIPSCQTLFRHLILNKLFIPISGDEVVPAWELFTKVQNIFIMETCSFWLAGWLFQRQNFSPSQQCKRQQRRFIIYDQKCFVLFVPC